MESGSPLSSQKCHHTKLNEEETFDGDQNNQTEESFSETFDIPCITLNDGSGSAEGRGSERVKSKRQRKPLSPNFPGKWKNLGRDKSKRNDASSGKHLKVDSSGKRERGRSWPPLFMQKGKSDEIAEFQEEKEGISAENIHRSEISRRQRRNAVCMILMPARYFKVLPYLRLLFKISMLSGTDLV